MRSRLYALAAVAAVATSGTAATDQSPSPDALAPAVVHGTESPASIRSFAWKTDDPRLSGEIVYDRGAIEGIEHDWYIDAGSAVLTTDGGRWTGAVTSLVVEGDEAGQMEHGSRTVISPGRVPTRA